MIPSHPHHSPIVTLITLYIPGKKRKSIWATPDVITGFEGVTGGTSLTQFEQRKRNVYDNDEEEGSD